MRKLASQDLDGLLIKSAATIREQNQEIARLRGQLAGHARQAHAEKIASAAVDRGILDADEATSYAEDLANGDRDLGAIEDLVSRSSSGVPLGEMRKVASDDSYSPSDGNSAEDRFLNSLLATDLA